MKVVLNDETIENDYGFRVLNSGIDLSRIEKNNPVIYHHNDVDLAIGNINNVRIEGSQLVGDVVWDEEDEDEFTKRLIGKYKRGVMKAFSMGLNIYEMRDDENAKPLATKSELCELSACTVQSNRNAVTVLNAQNHNIVYTRNGQQVQLSFNNNKIDFSTIEKTEMVDLKKLAVALGLPETATEAEIEMVAKSVKAELTAKTTELTALKSSQVDAAIAEGVTKGIVNDANKEHFKAMLSSNFAATKAIIDAVPTPKAETKTTEGDNTTTLKAMLSSNSEGKVETKSDETESFDYLQRFNSTKLASIKEKDPAKYAQLASDYKAGVRYKA